jgi:transposase
MKPAGVLLRLPGIGPVIATTMVALVGNANLFATARSFAALPGLTSRQHATGDKGRRLGKRGEAICVAS